MVMVHNVMLVMVVPLEYIRYFSVNGRHVPFVVLENVKENMGKVYEYGRWFVMSGIWSGRSGMISKVCSEGSLLIFMF